MESKTVDEGQAPVAFLVADFGCTTCRGLATATGDISDGRVAIRDIADPTLPTAVRERLEQKVEPLLFTRDGEDVSVWRGVALRAHLARLIGPAASARLITRVFGEAFSNDESDRDSGGSRPSRRRLLSTGALALGGAVLGIGSGAVLGTKSAAASETTPDGLGLVARKATADRKTISLLTASPQWAGAEKIARSHNLKPDLASSSIITSPHGFAAVDSVWRSPHQGAAAVATTSILDTNADRVAYVRTVEALGGAEPQVRVHDPNGLLFTIRADKSLTQESTHLRVVSPANQTMFEGTVGADGALTAAPGYTRIAERIQVAQMVQEGQEGQEGRVVHPNFWGLDLCQWAVGLLCSAGTGVGGFALCTSLTLATFGIGATCAVVMALIATLGCAGATYYICG